jgi:hypothetical protein
MTLSCRHTKRIDSVLKKNTAFWDVMPYSLTAILPPFWKHLLPQNSKLQWRLQATWHHIPEDSIRNKHGYDKVT